MIPVRADRAKSLRSAEGNNKGLSQFDMLHQIIYRVRSRC